MRPMETNRRVLTWFCLHPADENTGIMMKLIYAANAFVALSIAFLFFFGSCYYFWMFASTDLEKALGAVWTINGIMAEIYMFIVMLLSRQKIKSAFDALTEIYEASKNCLNHSWSPDQHHRNFESILKIDYYFQMQIKTKNPFAFWSVWTRNANGCGAFISNMQSAFWSLYHWWPGHRCGFAGKVMIPSMPNAYSNRHQLCTYQCHLSNILMKIWHLFT